MKTALIHHVNDPLNGEGLVRWLASFSEVVAVVEIEEPKSRLWKRIRREWKRSGAFRFFDVLAFRLYYKLRLAKNDRAWEAATLDALRAKYPAPNPPPPVLRVKTPNSPETEAFLNQHAPDMTIARCKSLLKKSIFAIPKHGTYVLHPGICPDYRNAHGCFWALAEGDFANVGMTLLRIDEGIDTGPVFAHYRHAANPAETSHVQIQAQVLIENLDAVSDKLLEIDRGQATPIDVKGRPSREWGQPWLSAYRRWRKFVARADVKVS